MPCKEAGKLSLFWAETPLPRIPVAKQKYAEEQKQEDRQNTESKCCTEEAYLA